MTITAEQEQYIVQHYDTYLSFMELHLATAGIHF